MSGAVKVVVLALTGAGVLGAQAVRALPSQEAAATPLASVEASTPRLLEFGSTRCAGCKAMHAELALLRGECPGGPEIVEVDVFEDSATAARFGVQVIPTQVFLDAERKELYRHEGFLARADIRDRFATHGVACAP